MAADEHVLPGWVQGVLDIGAGLVAAGALITATGVFAGREYARAYYETMGIPSSALSFGTDDYISLTSRIMLFTTAGVVAAAIGIIPGILVPTIGENRTRSRHRKMRHDVTIGLRKVPRMATQSIQRNPLLWAVIILLVLAVLATLGWVGWLKDALHWSYDKVGRELAIAAIIAAVAALLVSFAATWLFRHSSSGTPRRYAFAVAAATAVVLVVLGIILVAAGFIGHADARHHSLHSDHFIKATLVVQGAVGIDGEKPKAVKSGGTVPSTCEEFVQAGAAEGQAGAAASQAGAPETTASLCEISNVIVILRNNNHYFVSPAGDMDAKKRKVYPIKEDRIVRISFEGHD